ncbi:MAG TPA: hypothetical protein PK280_16980 [Planctomycetota bacterium]|nr:hypothetical protein [Planctomycetota bacterium]
MSWSRTAVVSVAVGVGLALALSLGARAGEDDDFAPAKPVAAAPAAGQALNGLEVTMLIKERSFRMGGGDNNAAERKVKVPTLKLKNVGDKPLVLDFQLGGGGMGGRFGGGPAPEASPVKFRAKDAAGKEILRQEPARPEGEAQPKPEERPATLTVLKPGQELEVGALGAIRFPADGKYKVWAEIDVAAKDEVLPGVKPWSGKLKSNEVDFDYQGFGRGGRGNNNNRPGGANPPAQAPAPGEKEAF